MNGLPAYWNGMGESTAQYLIALVDGTNKSWAQLLDSMRINEPWGENNYEPMRGGQRRARQRVRSGPDAAFGHVLKRARSTREGSSSGTRSGAHRSPRLRSRAGTLRTVKSAISILGSSFHVTGVDTDASGVGRTE